MNATPVIKTGRIAHDATPIGEAPTDCPKWAKAGVRVKVKRTDITRTYGVRCRMGFNDKHDDRVWPGEIGTVTIEQGNGWYRFIVEFARGRDVVPHGDGWEEFKRIPVPRAKPAQHVCMCGSTAAPIEGDQFATTGYRECPSCGCV